MKRIGLLPGLFLCLLTATAVSATAARQLAAEPQQNRPKMIRVGGKAQATKLVHKVMPVYPAAARKARIQGTLTLDAVVGKDGSVEALHYVSGPPLLVQSAMDAVRQWRYKPTLLNGEPVAVETKITVVYSLSGSVEAGSGAPQFPAERPVPPQAEGACRNLWPSSVSPARPRVIQVGPHVEMSKLLHSVMPVYPPEAKQAGIQGEVRLCALIGADGRVERLQSLSGPPALVKPALDAVRQWVFRPTLLNGSPVQVETPISVIYSLPDQP